MARIKPGKPAPTKPKSAAKPSSSRDAVAERGAHPLARRRFKALAILVAAGVIALASYATWQRVAPLVATRARYRLPAAAIITNAPPEWIVADVRQQVVQRSGLDGRLSLLDKGFDQELENAFVLHPWVEQVTRIEKSYPPAVRLELVYRRPVAVIESPAEQGFALLPVDSRGVMLPPDDVPLIRRKYLPRITGIVGQPRAGERWDDPRVAGAVELAVDLADSWDALHLAEIVPSARPEVQGNQNFFVYDIVTQGGTRIVWGASPQAAVDGEADFHVKRERLEQSSQQYGPFDSVESPDVVNIRQGISVTPRQAKNSAIRQAYHELHRHDAGDSIIK